MSPSPEEYRKASETTEPRIKNACGNGRIDSLLIITCSEEISTLVRRRDRIAVHGYQAIRPPSVMKDPIHLEIKVQICSSPSSWSPTLNSKVYYKLSSQYRTVPHNESY